MDKKAILKNLDYINLNTQRIKVFTKRITNQSDKNKSMTDKRLKKIDQKADRIKYLTGAIREQINESESPELKIQDGKLYFLDGGREQFLGVGVWRREALCLETGQEGCTWQRCGQNYSLTWAEREFHKYGLNYLRTDICNNPSLVRGFCEKMYEKNVIVELTLRDGKRDLGSIEETIEATKDLKNIIYECWNELYSEDDVDRAISVAKNLREQGLIVSGGAFGAGGEEYAGYAKKKGLYDIVSIIQVHRHWPYPNHEDNDTILDYKNYKKPIGRNEFFDRRELGLRKIRFIFEKSIEHGASLVCYYGFRVPGLGSECDVDAEGNPYYKYLEIASDVLSKYEKAKH